MNCCVNAGYVSLISRWLSAAMASNTSDDLPDPDTPVNTVSFRFGISSDTFLRLFSRAPRISIDPYALSDLGMVSPVGFVRECRAARVDFDAATRLLTPGVIPANAGIQARFSDIRTCRLDSRCRGIDAGRGRPYKTLNPPPASPALRSWPRPLP